MLGGERDRIAEAETEGFVDAGLARSALGLVGDDDDWLAGATHSLREMAVGVGDAGARIEHEQDRVAIDEGHFRLRAHSARERFRFPLFEAGGVDDGEGEVRDPALAFATIAGDAGLSSTSGEPAPNQAIEQRRLADVRPADNRDFDAHIVPVRGGGAAVTSPPPIGSRR